MNFKSYIKIFGATAVALGLSSCDDFLDREPISSGTTSNSYTSAKDAEAALTGAYDTFHQEYYIWDNIIFNDVMSDNHYAGGDNPEIIAIDNLNLSPTNARLYNNWNQLYNGIAKANVVLQKVPLIADAALDENNRRNQILGEASFLRAHHYYQLVKHWGDVPLITEPVSSTEASVVNVERTSATEVYNQIVADLEFAAANLPDTYSADASVNKARATRGAANAMLAKVWAQRADRDYSKVLQYADLVINSPAGYTLLENYDQLFDGAHYNNAESILEVQFVPTTELNWGPGLLLPPTLTGNSWRKFVVPSRDLVAAFESEGDEVRKNASILFEEAPWADEFWSPAVNGEIPFSFKWRVAMNSTNRQYLLRLADIILLKAEALNALDRPEEAAEQLNIVRTRAGLDPTEADSKAELALAIEKERRLELAQEGQRWDDLKRYGRAIEVMNNLEEFNLVTQQYINYNMDQNKLLLPIPQSERNRNPNLGQNTGYN